METPGHTSTNDRTPLPTPGNGEVEEARPHETSQWKQTPNQTEEPATPEVVEETRYEWSLLLFQSWPYLLFCIDAAAFEGEETGSHLDIYSFHRALTVGHLHWSTYARNHFSKF